MTLYNTVQKCDKAEDNYQLRIMLRRSKLNQEQHLWKKQTEHNSPLSDIQRTKWKSMNPEENEIRERKRPLDPLHPVQRLFPFNGGPPPPPSPSAGLICLV